jgi:hypothetical protein
MSRTPGRGRRAKRLQPISPFSPTPALTGQSLALRKLCDAGRIGEVRLCYGAIELRGAPRARDITEAQAETILNKLLDAGINYIDTSSEERIGRYISHRRTEYWSAPPGTTRPAGAQPFTRENVVAGG